MNYHALLTHHINKSGWSMREISRRCKERDVNVSQSYLSQLCRGVVNPASDKVNKELGNVLSIVTDIEPNELVIASYKMKIPVEILELITN